MNNKLYHSDIYLGQDFSDGIRHYKYLKKVKSASGKWRYIYDESELKSEEKKINALKSAQDKLRDKNGNYRYIDSKGNTVIKKDGYTATTYSNSKQTAADKAKEKLDSELSKKIKKHTIQKIKDIPKRTISRGIGLINKLLFNAEKKWIKK